MRGRAWVFRVGTARQKMALERWTNPKPQRRPRRPRYGVLSCRGGSAGVAKRPRERYLPPETPRNDSHLLHRQVITCKGHGSEVDMWSLGVLAYELLVGAARSVSLSLSLSHGLSAALSLSHGLSAALSLSHGLFAALSLSLSRSLCGSLSLSLSHGFSAALWQVGESPFVSESDMEPEEIFKSIVRGNYKIPELMSPAAADLIMNLLRREPVARLGCVPGSNLQLSFALRGDSAASSETLAPWQSTASCVAHGDTHTLTKCRSSLWCDSHRAIPLNSAFLDGGMLHRTHAVCCPTNHSKEDIHSGVC
jgi:serine/threonine protein kinase